MQRVRMKAYLKRNLSRIVYGVFFSMLLAWVAILRFQHLCTQVDVAIAPRHLSFVNEEHVSHMLQYFSARSLIGTPYRSLNTHIMERHLAKHDYIAACQIHKDWRGTLHVSVEQERPLARLLTGRGDHYLTASGRLIPVSADYTSRVVVVSYPHFRAEQSEGFVRSPVGRSLLHLVTHLHADVFWREQVAQINISARGEVSFYPQLAWQEALLGPLLQLPPRLADQLSRLKLFYTQVLPTKGWDFYRVVDLRSDGQIIGRKSRG